MKGFSVFVVCFYLRTACSYYMGSAVPSNPNISQKEYLNPNSQNIYQSNRPDITTSRLSVNKQNAYTNQETISAQPSPIQQVYKMGPGMPIPYQTAPRIQNNIPYNLPISPIHYIASNPHVKEKYKTSIPTKHYTIVHPNGTIEDTDEINAVTAKYPNFLLVKASDILAHINQPNTYKNSINPPQNTHSNLLSKSVTTTQKFQPSPTNSYESRQKSLINTELERQNYANLNNQESRVPLTDVRDESSNPAKFNETESVTTEENNRQANIHNFDKNAVAANPLPIYQATPVPDDQEKYKQSPELTATNDTEPVYPTVIQDKSDEVSYSNSTNSNDSLENQNVASNQTISSKPTTVTIQVPDEVDEHKVLEVDDQSESPEIQTDTHIEKPHQSYVPTIEKPIISNNVNLTSLPSNTSSISNLTKILSPNTAVDESLSKTTKDEKIVTVQSSELSANTTDIPEVKSNSTNSSMFNQSSTAFGNDAPLTWFHLSDDSIWDAIQNNATNVYFFFLPPRPNIIKETRTTIFPNGTAIEEIIERSANKDQELELKDTNNATSINS